MHAEAGGLAQFFCDHAFDSLVIPWHASLLQDNGRFSFNAA